MLSPLAGLRKTVLGFPQAFWFLWGGTLLNRVGMLVLPFLAIYLTSERHLAPQVVGLIVALPGLGGILASLLMSLLADRLSRKFIFVASLSVSACFLLTIPFLSSLLWLAGMVLFWSIASEAQRPLAGMLVMDLVSQKQRRQAISVLRLAINVGSMVSASIGGLIASQAFLPLFGADAGTTLLFALFMLLLFPRPVSPLPKVQASRPSLALFAPFRDRAFRRIWLVGFFTTMVLSQQTTTFAVYLTKLGGSPAFYGGLMAAGSFLVILLEVPLTAFFQRVQSGRVMALGSLILALAAGTCSLVAGPYWLALPLLAFVFGNMLFSPPYDTIGADLAPVEQRGTYMSFLWIATGLGFALGPVLGGVLLSYSPLLCWSIVGGIGLLAVALAWNIGSVSHDA
ncbi:MFS transporter [Ktedonobacter sp. SOSP1-85]|uniref:MFS transporter n=1 Tax=Ktedonobacter sp. SOSP1-85 TaxID=2778367 RepID=UPI001915B6CE|nr:MFS transporter [Ktedonobacter sp. SOSP1-85]GHO73334.1 MFS transporter [Ktedonobacter sp. SOSP1-85]